MPGSSDTQRTRSSTLTRIGRFLTGSSQTVDKPHPQSSAASSRNLSRSSSVRKDGGDSQTGTPSGGPSAEALTAKLGQLHVDRVQDAAKSVSPDVRAHTPPPGGTVAGSTSGASFSRASSVRKPQTQPRFKIIGEGGAHEHHLKVIKRQEKLGQMVKDWIVGSTKKRSEAVSAVPNLFAASDVGELNSQAKKALDTGKLPPTLFATYMQERDAVKVRMEGPKSLQQVTPVAGAAATAATQQAPSKVANFEDKYGKCQEVIGKGTFGIVRVAHKRFADKEVLYAVKEFTRKQNEGDKKYANRLTNEFCISSSLKHINIIDVFDLFKDAKGEYCEVMEYCQGGDLYSLIITAGKLEYAEADCMFKQLLRAVHYMHSMGVTHRDLKPENILLTHDGTLKITDFGNAECFKMAWEEEVHFSHGIAGSSPYIAPEEYTMDEFDPRCVDVWSCGVIYMAMRTGRQLWQTASKGDEFFDQYLHQRKAAKGYEPIEILKRARCRNVIYSILDPIPSRRITALQVLKSEWVREINCCKG